jgi:transcriptional regulator PpsR
VTREHAQPPSFAALRNVDATSLIAAASDLALLVDAKGVIRDVAIAGDDLSGLGSSEWIGRRWTETVTVESRPKVEALLLGATQASTQKWRHINHFTGQGSDLPVMYSAIQAGPEGEVVAIGRDLRQFATMQQRLIVAQQSMERDYLRLRQMETRYRALFQSVSEAVLIADASTLKVLEANAAAARLFGEPVKRIAGKPITDCFDQTSRAALLGMLEAARNSRQADAARVRTVGAGADVEASASVFRQDSGTLLLIRVALPAGSTHDDPAGPARRALLAAVERAPDALVVTDPGGRVLYANASFTEMVQLDAGGQVVGESLDRWLGRSGVDLGVLLANLKQSDSVRAFPTVMRGSFGGETAVEISAAAVPDPEHPCLGFTIRDVGRRLPAEGRAAQGQSRTVAQLAELVGRVPMKDIVGETTDLIEQLCIEAALQLTRDNRAAAAEMLGLSRQSLYVKLRRYGLSEHPVEGEQ